MPKGSGLRELLEVVRYVLEAEKDPLGRINVLGMLLTIIVASLLLVMATKLPSNVLIYFVQLLPQFLYILFWFVMTVIFSTAVVYCWRKK